MQRVAAVCCCACVCGPLFTLIIGIEGVQLGFHASSTETSLSQSWKHVSREANLPASVCTCSPISNSDCNRSRYTWYMWRQHTPLNTHMWTEDNSCVILEKVGGVVGGEIHTVTWIRTHTTLCSLMKWYESRFDIGGEGWMQKGSFLYRRGSHPPSQFFSLLLRWFDWKSTTKSFTLQLKGSSARVSSILLLLCHKCMQLKIILCSWKKKSWKKLKWFHILFSGLRFVKWFWWWSKIERCMELQGLIQW